MKTLKAGLSVLIVLGLTGIAFAAGSTPSDKSYTPSWDMDQGGTTTHPKAHMARVDFTPEHMTSLDKQGKPWFQSTLNPNNVRREDAKPKDRKSTRLNSSHRL